MGTEFIQLATALSITATGQQTPINLTTSPFQGGQNKNAVLFLQNAIAGGGVVTIQGNPLIQPNAPASGDANWFTIATLNAASLPQQEILLPPWIAVNVTTAGTGTVSVGLLGVQ